MIIFFIVAFFWWSNGRFHNTHTFEFSWSFQKQSYSRGCSHQLDSQGTVNMSSCPIFDNFSCLEKILVAFDAQMGFWAFGICPWATILVALDGNNGSLRLSNISMFILLFWYTCFSFIIFKYVFIACNYGCRNIRLLSHSPPSPPWKTLDKT